MLQGPFPLDHEFFHQGDRYLEELAAKHFSAQEDQTDRSMSLDRQFDDEPLEDLKCQSCGVCVMTHHLLDLHITEAHDPFFAAQAARRLKVFRCLVEGCEKLFTSIADRKKHLADYHLWPTNFAFDRMHLGKKQAQQRPGASFQNADPGRAKTVAQTRQSEALQADSMQPLISNASATGSTSAPLNVDYSTTRDPSTLARIDAQREGQSDKDPQMQDSQIVQKSLDRDTKISGRTVQKISAGTPQDMLEGDNDKRTNRSAAARNDRDAEMLDVEALSKKFARLKTAQPKAMGVRASRLQL